MEAFQDKCSMPAYVLINVRIIAKPLLHMAVTAALVLSKEPSLCLVGRTSDSQSPRVIRTQGPQEHSTIEQRPVIVLKRLKEPHERVSSALMI